VSLDALDESSKELSDLLDRAVSAQRRMRAQLAAVQLQRLAEQTHVLHLMAQVSRLEAELAAAGAPAAREQTPELLTPLWTFSGTEQLELSVKVGDVLERSKEQPYRDWTHCKLLGGDAAGFVPTAYLQSIRGSRTSCRVTVKRAFDGSAYAQPDRPAILSFRATDHVRVFLDDKCCLVEPPWREAINVTTKKWGFAPSQFISVDQVELPPTEPAAVRSAAAASSSSIPASVVASVAPVAAVNVDPATQITSGSKRKAADASWATDADLQPPPPPKPMPNLTRLTTAVCEAEQPPANSPETTVPPALSPATEANALPTTVANAAESGAAHVETEAAEPQPQATAPPTNETIDVDQVPTPEEPPPAVEIAAPQDATATAAAVQADASAAVSKPVDARERMRALLRQARLGQMREAEKKAIQDTLTPREHRQQHNSGE